MAASASDAHPFPIYNARYRFIAPLLDADGDLVTGAGTPDSEISQDCGTFADATNEMTEIATSSGMYYLDLIATEMDTKSTAVIMKSATAGMKTTPIVLYPRRLPVIRTGTAQAGAASSITLDSSASAITDYYVGCYVNITNDSPAGARGQARLITAYDGSTKVATVESTYGTNPSSASTFEVLSTELWIQCKADVNAFGGVAGTFASGRPEVNTTHFGGSSLTQSGGRPEVNTTHWSGTANATPTVAGVPEVDVTHWLGTAAATPTVAGVPEVDVTHFGGSAGTFSGGRAEVNASHIGGSAISQAAGVANVNVTQLSGDSVAADNAEAFFDGTGYAGTGNTIPTVTNLTNAPTNGDLTATMKASVNTEVLDVLNVDTFAEPGQEAPPATTTLVKKIGYLYKFLRNKITQNATTLQVYADDGTTVDQKATVSDDGTTYTRGEIATGP